MSRFPFFKELKGTRALVVGGGEVALRRAAALLDCGAKVTCIAEVFCDGFSGLDAECFRRKFEVADAGDWDIVIAATDDKNLNASIARLAKEWGSEVNVADAPELSTFLFPGIVRRGGMTIGISSDGASPSAVKYVRERVEQAIPDHFESVLQSMETARKIVRNEIPQQKKRSEVLRKVFDSCLHAPQQPEKAEIEEMIRRIGCADLD